MRLVLYAFVVNLTASILTFSLRHLRSLFFSMKHSPLLRFFTSPPWIYLLFYIRFTFFFRFFFGLPFLLLIFRPFFITLPPPPQPYNPSVLEFNAQQKFNTPSSFLWWLSRANPKINGTVYYELLLNLYVKFWENLTQGVIFAFNNKYGVYIRPG